MYYDELNRESDMLWMLHYKGERLFTEVVNKVISKYKAFVYQENTDLLVHMTRNWSEMMRVIKQDMLYKLANTIVDKVEFVTTQNPDKFTSRTKGSCYVLSEEEIKGLVWDSYMEALNTMRKQIYDKR